MKDYFAAAAKWVTAFIFFAFSPLLALAEDAPLRLAMFEQAGCHWCARWHEEVGPIYPKTPEAARAPLMVLQIHDDLPEDISLTRPARFTPTFVLLQDGAEVGRIEGYPGQDFFWALLDELLARADTPR